MLPLNYRETLIPDKALVIANAIISVIIVGIGTTMLRLNSYLASLGGATVEHTISESFDYFQRNLVNASIAGRITAGVFWACFGLAIYLIYWAIHNVVANYHNERVFKLTYTHPPPDVGYAKHQHRIIAAKVLHWSCMVLFPFVCFVAIRSVLPLVLQLGVRATSVGLSLNALLVVLLSVGITLGTLLLINILARLAFGEYDII